MYFLLSRKRVWFIAVSLIFYRHLLLKSRHLTCSRQNCFQINPRIYNKNSNARINIFIFSYTILMQFFFSNNATTIERDVVFFRLDTRQLGVRYKIYFEEHSGNRVNERPAREPQSDRKRQYRHETSRRGRHIRDCNENLRRAIIYE